MGLLDDAIREHLELKRRRGADAGELERQEQEALGPPRKGEFVRPEGEAAPAEAAPAEAEPPEPVAEVEEPPAEAPPRVQEPPVEARPPAAEPIAEVPAPEAPPEPWLDEPDEVPVDDALEHPGAAPEPDPDVVTPDPEPAGDDVLEETPDFLQETPEHDRLWFEQKPPRDFDFDK